MRCKRGEIVLVLFPNSNLRTAKRRPALIVQADNLNTGLNQTIVALISSNISRANHPARMRLVLNSTEGRQAGILMDSVVMADNLANIREIEIDRRLGVLSEMKDVDVSLRRTLALS